MKTFADRLKYARELRQLSQGQLARACGLAQSTISSYESGMRKGSNQLLGIAQALEVNVYWLSNGQEPMFNPPGAALTLAETKAGWPFPSIDPRQYWALPAKDRQAVENAVSVLISSLQENPRSSKG